MLGRLVGQNTGGIALVGGIFIATWMLGFWFGTMTVPNQPTPPVPIEQVRADAIRRCFNDTSGRLNRNWHDPEVLTNITEQCRRVYDGR